MSEREERDINAKSSGSGRVKPTIDDSGSELECEIDSRLDGKHM